MAGQNGGTAPLPVRNASWSLLASPLGRQLLQQVCAVMVRRLERKRGAPTLESRGGIVRLWRIPAYREVSSLPETPWVLDDGTRLRPEDPVLEFHIAAPPLLAALATGTPWRLVVAEEFASLAPSLAAREEVALVGTTILQRQVAAFGASVRPPPRSLHHRLDTFYRKLILIAFHPGGAGRVLAQKDALADAAISRREFCRRFMPDREPAAHQSAARSSPPKLGPS